MKPIVVVVVRVMKMRLMDVVMVSLLQSVVVR